MIRDHLLALGSDYVKLSWTHPQFLPEMYQVTYTCTTMTRFTTKYDMKNNITSNTQYLSSDTTSFRISDLLPRSNCTLVLLAAYNRASIDSGITITGTTVDEGASKKNFGLDNFVVTLGYYHVYYSTLHGECFMQNISCIKSLLHLTFFGLNVQFSPCVILLVKKIASLIFVGRTTHENFAHTNIA